MKEAQGVGRTGGGRNDREKLKEDKGDPRWRDRDEDRTRRTQGEE